MDQTAALGAQSTCRSCLARILQRQVNHTGQKLAIFKPEWKEFMEKGAFKDSFMTGKDYTDWVARAEDLHRTLMQEAGFIAR